MATGMPGTDGANGKKSRAPKTAERIASELRRRIVVGELKEGDPLPSEAEFMEQFQVSRPTLREAHRILEAESLIRIRRGSQGGARVTAPQPGVAARYAGLLLQTGKVSIGDVYEARSVIEPAAARMLAGSRTSADIEELRACIDRLREMVDGQADSAGPDLHGWAMGVQQFHDLVVDRAGNRTLAVQAAVLREVVSAHLEVVLPRSFDRVHTPEEFRRLVRSYTKLVDLIAMSDAEGAEKHWRRHLEMAATALIPGEEAEATVDLFA